MTVYLQLGNTKAQDGKTTLIHFLASTVEQKLPDCLHFQEELSHLDKAAKGRTISEFCATQCGILILY